MKYVKLTKVARCLVFFLCVFFMCLWSSDGSNTTIFSRLCIVYFFFLGCSIMVFSICLYITQIIYKLLRLWRPDNVRMGDLYPFSINFDYFGLVLSNIFGISSFLLQDGAISETNQFRQTFMTFAFIYSWFFSAIVVVVVDVQLPVWRHHEWSKKAVK